MWSRLLSCSQLLQCAAVPSAKADHNILRKEGPHHPLHVCRCSRDEAVSHPSVSRLPSIRAFVCYSAITSPIIPDLRLPFVATRVTAYQDQDHAGAHWLHRFASLLRATAVKDNSC